MVFENATQGQAISELRKLQTQTADLLKSKQEISRASYNFPSFEMSLFIYI